MKKALAIMTYTRRDYFSLVYASILAQKINGKPITEEYDIYVFQDGIWDKDQLPNKLEHGKMRQWIQQLPAHIQTYTQTKNLGVALHFDFIERLLFLEKKYDFVAFFEDDLILAPGYMSVLNMMADKFHNDPRVGMVSAHPTTPTFSLDIQKARRHEYTSMGHNWGFGVSREFWLKRQPFVDNYLEIVRDVPYRDRPHQVIFDWLKSMGINPAGSSQDYIKNCSTYLLGGLRLATFPNYGLPIGRTGLHCTPSLFKEMGFDHTVVYDTPLESISDLSTDEYRHIYSQSGHQMGERFVHIVEEPDQSRLKQIQQQILAGDYHPKKIVPHFFQKKNEIMTKKWVSTDIPLRPHMEDEGINLLEKHMANSNTYLEYGSGGSTVFAAIKGIPNIHSIDSDIGFLDAVKARALEQNSNASINLHPVNIGPTKEWGHPTDKSHADQWPKYSCAAWDFFLEKNINPDLILIDGRFRVACFLASLMFAKPGTVILFDDYFDRPGYHSVEKHLRPRSQAGRMAEFVVDASFNTSKVLLDLLIASTNPA